jgi:CarD family transcriptional regulator
MADRKAKRSKKLSTGSRKGKVTKGGRNKTRKPRAAARASSAPTRRSRSRAGGSSTTQPRSATGTTARTASASRSKEVRHSVKSSASKSNSARSSRKASAASATQAAARADDVRVKASANAAEKAVRSVAKSARSSSKSSRVRAVAASAEVRSAGAEHSSDASAAAPARVKSGVAPGKLAKSPKAAKAAPQKPTVSAMVAPAADASHIVWESTAAPVPTSAVAQTTPPSSASFAVAEQATAVGTETPQSAPTAISSERATPERSDQNQVTQKKTTSAASLSAASAPLPGAAGPVSDKIAPAKASAAAPVRATTKPADTRPIKQAPNRVGFKANEYIVYPAHGVGQIVQIEEQEVAGFKLELFVINFVKDKMTLKVPLPKVLSGAIRKLAEPETVKKALDTLTGRARVKRTMWSRRAQEYEAKINSGDLVAIAEVVRDLYRSEAQPEQSYSERQLYEAALDRMAREIAAVQKLTDTESLKLIEGQLQKGPRRATKAEAAAEAELGDADIDEAA